jgi:peptidoglycan/LPS O-acetylase OafA/YrhL
MKYIGTLDGVRGVAVILVMLFHFGYFAPGWVGVQLFFVLSGFLITRILLESRSASLSRNLSRFYWRRALRILPVLFLLLIASAMSFEFFGFPDTFERDWPWMVAFTANFGRVGNDDLHPFYRHIWSLAVEEQFYILWPFALFLLSINSIKRLIVATLILAPVLRLVLFNAMVGSGYDTTSAGLATYVLPFTQFDAFATGAAIAVWPSLSSIRVERKLIVTIAVAAVCGVSALAWSHLVEGGAYFASLGYPLYLVPVYGYVWGYSLLNFLFLLVIVGAIQSPKWMAPFSNKPLAYAGKISYGLYVYHLPLLVAGDRFAYPLLTNQSTLWRVAYFLVWVALVIVFASLSYRCVEEPLLRLKNRLWGRPHTPQ